jgi:indole-3-glycerol phosphate synthase/phosphoribosylanthranilate isomerase
MVNVLETIVENKRKEVAERELAFPLARFKDQLLPSEKSLFDSLNRSRVGFIFECKKASPSKGLIRENFDLDEILAAYLPYAAGLSVLTDEKYFQGNYEYLAYATERSTVPVLNKDFFVSAYQVYLARYYHADAVLLMLSVLSDSEYRQLATIAKSLHLDILTEVSNEEEMVRAIDLQANIIGINNRNLRDLSTDLATTERLIPLLKEAKHDHVVISESGIYTHDDVKRLSTVSHGFLVGSSLMAEADLAKAVKQLVFGRVKVCGITRVEDCANALRAGASYIGLIFVPESPRFISIEDAQALTKQSTKQTTQQSADFVGVFRNHSVEQILAHVALLPLSVVQLHGNESETFRQTLLKQLPEHIEIWQATPMSKQPTEAQIESAKALLGDESCHRVLFDCKVGGKEGGTGETFDWSVLSELPNTEKWIIAGGIGKHNIEQAKRLSPHIIDVNSCAESAPGVKSNEALEHIFEKARCKAVSHEIS